MSFRINTNIAAMNAHANAVVNDTNPKTMKQFIIVFNAFLA